jgi:hypothetical protein
VFKGDQSVVKSFKTTAAPMKAVTVNGKLWTECSKDNETITLLRGLASTVAMAAQY